MRLKAPRNILNARTTRLRNELLNRVQVFHGTSKIGRPTLSRRNHLFGQLLRASAGKNTVVGPIFEQDDAEERGGTRRKCRGHGT